MKDPDTEITRFGFIFGSAHVERVAMLPQGHAVLHISGGKGKFIEVYVSPGGRSVRVFNQDGSEMKA